MNGIVVIDTSAMIYFIGHTEEWKHFLNVTSEHRVTVCVCKIAYNIIDIHARNRSHRIGRGQYRKFKKITDGFKIYEGHTERDKGHVKFLPPPKKQDLDRKLGLSQVFSLDHCLVQCAYMSTGVRVGLLSCLVITKIPWKYEEEQFPCRTPDAYIRELVNG